VRIVSGKYKGRIFRPSGKIPARPTTDFAKENLFNILENQCELQGAEALDLFAGTGNISFEFISRGCARVTAVEKGSRQIQFIHRVMKTLEIDNLKVIKKDVFRFIDAHPGTFDIIFADPPYQMEGREQLPELIVESQLLSPGGVFILEHDKHLTLPDTTNLSDQRKYGTVHFSFFSAPSKNHPS